MNLPQNPELDQELAGFAHYLDGVRSARGHRYSAHTVHAYVLSLRRALVVGDLTGELRRARTTSRWLVAKSAALAWARWKGNSTLEAQVLDMPDPLVDSRETQPPSAEAWSAIRAAARRLDEPQRSALALLLGTGLRAVDVFLLTREHAHLAQSNSRIAIGQKGARGRNWIPSSEAREALAALLQVPGWQRVRDLFDPYVNRSDRDDRQRHAAAYHQLRRLLGEVCRQAGVEYVRPHRFRHGVSEAVRQRGLPVEALQEILGHRDIRTTRRWYIHVEADRQRAALDAALAGIDGQLGRRV